MMARVGPDFRRRGVMIWRTPLIFFITSFLFLLSSARYSVAADRQSYLTAYGCEGATLSITCDPGRVINVIRANYGRFSVTICNEQGKTDWSVNCKSSRTHRVLDERCSGENSCVVGVSSEVFGDPCPSTFKYIEVHYTCVLAISTSTTERPRPPWFNEKRPPVWLPPPPLNHNSSVVKHSGVDVTTSVKVTVTKPTTTTAKTTTVSTTTSTTPTTTTTKKPTIKTTVKSKKEFALEDVSAHPPYEEPAVHHPTVSPERYPSVYHHTPNKVAVPSSTAVPRRALPITPPSFTKDGDYDTPWCAPSFARGLYWNWTRGGETAELSCPVGATGTARRSCLAGEWGGPADLSECRSAWLTALEARATKDDAVLSVTVDLAKVTAGKELYGGDLITAARLIKTLSRRMMEAVAAFPEIHQRQALVTEMLISVLETGSALLSAGMAGPWGDLSMREKRDAVTELMIGLEEATFLLANVLPRASQAAHFKSHVMASSRAVPADGSSVRFPSKDDLNLDWSFTDTVEIPPEAVLENSEGSSTRVIFLTYRHLEDLLTPMDERLGNLPKRNVSRIVNSRIVAASLGHGRHIQLPEPVTLTFALLRHDNVSNPVCAFWDYTTFAWGDEGCRVTQRNRTHVTCKCDHLTNFAVIMEESSGEEPTVSVSPLRILAYVGCFVASLFIFGSIAVFTLFRGIASPRTFIQRHVCVCLLVAEVTFMVSMWRMEFPVLCVGGAGLMHYTILAAFAWTFLEALQIYSSTCRALDPPADPLIPAPGLRWWHYLFAYGLPLLVVSCSAVIDPFSFGSKDFCFLRTDNYFIFALVVPALILLLLQIGLLAAALIRTCKLSPDEAIKTKEMARLASTRSWLRSALALLVLMVLTWTMGFLMLHQPSLATATTFCILNSLHGLLIFVNYCVRNQKNLDLQSRDIHRETTL